MSDGPTAPQPGSPIRRRWGGLRRSDLVLVLVSASLLLAVLAIYAIESLTPVQVVYVFAPR